MRKKLLLSILLAGSLAANAQTTIFAENWDGTGPGISGWTLYDLDGNTPWADDDPLPGLITDAWNVLSLSDIQTALDNPAYAFPVNATGMAGNVAVSNSWYDPAGTANDWLVSPAITIPAGATDVNLNWAANSLGDTQWLEDYEVNISTTNNQVASFTQLLNVPNELNSGNYRTVSLTAYAGQTIYIAFRNKGNDQYTMLLDNISVTGNTTAGVNDHLASLVAVYPNPSADVVNISNNSNILISGIDVSDLNGRTVKSYQYENVTEAGISLSGLSSGIYMMSVLTDKGNFMKKIVKN